MLQIVYSLIPSWTEGDRFDDGVCLPKESNNILRFFAAPVIPCLADEQNGVAKVVWPAR